MDIDAFYGALKANDRAWLATWIAEHGINGEVSSWPLLYLAAGRSSVETLEWLRDQGAEIGDALFAARTVKTAKWLYAQGADVHARNFLDVPLAHAWTKSLPLLKWLHRSVPEYDWGAKDSHDRTVLHAAIAKRNFKAAMLLVGFGVALEVRDNMGMTPLMHAAASTGFAFEDLCVALVAAGADACAVRESDEMSVLKFAVKERTGKAIEALIAAGAQVEGPPDTTQTPLMLAARNGNVAAIVALLAAGADPHATCGLPWAKGKTAADLAEMERRARAAEHLRAAMG